MTAYDLKSLKLPVLSGTGLELFAAAFQQPAIRSLMKGSLLNNGGITKLRQNHFTEFPTFSPLIGAEKPANSALCLPELKDLPQGLDAAFPYRRIRDYAQAYRQGLLSPVDTARRFLGAYETSEALNPPLRSFVAVDPSDLLRQAEESAQRFAAGKPLSIFDGVPVTVKDEMDMVPFPTTVGTTFMGQEPARQDATIVARLRAAGALLLGKANMHEIGINPDGSNAHYGRVCNPWNLAHDPGGSSSGPSAAVAAGFSPVALGADGGGSIRIPAAHCGVLGLKPTYGRISEFGTAPLAWSVGNLGPIASSAEDLMLVYAAIAGPDEKGPLSLYQPEVTVDGWSQTDLSGLRLGIYWDYFSHAQEEIVSINKTLVDRLVDAGASIVEIEIPDLDFMRIAHALTILSEMRTNVSRYPDYEKLVAPSTLVSLTLAGEFTAEDYHKAQQIRTRAMKTMLEIFQKVDVIITPATAVASPCVAEKDCEQGWSDLGLVTELMRFVFIANLLGLPAMSFPAGYNQEGLPVGMQVMGRHWEEHILLRIAHAAEQVVERKQPAVYYDLLQ